MVSRAFLVICPVILLSILLASCDQISSRYELSKDQKGRTLRLDKRTGDIAIIDDDKIISLKDARDVEARHKEALSKVVTPKYWPPLDLPQFKLRARLTTIWRDGQVLYAVQLRPYSPKAKGGAARAAEADKQETKEEPKLDANIIVRSVEGRPFFLVLEDVPFELANERLSFVRVVDDESKPTGLDAKGRIAMSRESYEKVDSWNVSWR